MRDISNKGAKTKLKVTFQPKFSQLKTKLKVIFQPKFSQLSSPSAIYKSCFSFHLLTDVNVWVYLLFVFPHSQIIYFGHFIRIKKSN